MTRATASQPSLSEISWGISTLTGIVRSMMPWSACLKTGRIVRFLLRCTVTMVLWTVIHQRLCVIPRHACQRLLGTFFKISIKTLFLGLGTLMIQRRNQPFYLQPFQTFWSMVRQGFLRVMLQTFRPITLLKSSMRWSI